MKNIVCTVICNDTYNTLIVIDCGPPPNIINGSPGTPTNTTFGGTVMYTCESGYEISTGMSTISCLNTGIWDTPPTCTGNPQLLMMQECMAVLNVCVYNNMSRSYSCGLWTTP